MGYHPETLAFSFPPYPRGGVALGRNEKKPWSIGRAFYALKPWIGFDVWHIDPEKPGTGNRRDDSCGWFDRTAGEYQRAVNDFLTDKGAMQDVASALGRKEWHKSAYLDEYPESQRGFDMLPLGDSAALVLMVALHLERRRWWDKRYPSPLWKKPFYRERNVIPLALNLALNTVDNLRSVETPEGMVKSIAAALNRHYRPWWKHPRWHVHHWDVKIDLWRNLRRMFQRCAGCRKRLGFAYCPTVMGDDRAFHHDCAGAGMAKAPVQ